jgi:hypothetical protein
MSGREVGEFQVAAQRGNYPNTLSPWDWSSEADRAATTTSRIARMSCRSPSDLTAAAWAALTGNHDDTERTSRGPR